METHGICTDALRKENQEGIATGLRHLTCGDCGHVFLIAQGQQSGLCAACGNIETLSRGILAKRVLPRLRQEQQQKIDNAATPDPLLVFQATPDGHAVEALRMRLQVEWQLWAALVKDFGNPALHAAYLCTTTAAHELEKAAARYREHRAVMMVSAELRWQAEVCELMLARIENLSLLRMESEAGNGWAGSLPAWFYHVPLNGRGMRFCWVLVGITLMVRIFYWASH